MERNYTIGRLHAQLAAAAESADPRLPAALRGLLRVDQGGRASPLELETSNRQLELDQHWLTRLAQLKDYIAATGQLPRYKKFVTDHEHTLGVWLHIQHQKRAEKTLLPWRLQALNVAHPDWGSHA